MKRILIAAFLLIGFSSGYAGTPAEAVAYMQKLDRVSAAVSLQMWEYIKTTAHNDNPRQAALQLDRLIATVNDSLTKTKALPDFDGDSDLKNALTKYLSTMLAILRQDYTELVDMEEISEQSYDDMEAFLLAKKKANEKLDEASEILAASEASFAKKNNVNLTQTESELGSKLRRAGEVMGYYNRVYLIFFKSHKEENSLVEAMKTEDISKIEQSRKSLAKYSKNGLKQLKKIKPFEKDSTLVDACRNYLEFTRQEAEKEVPLLTNHLIRKEEFDRIRHAMEAKKASERTQEDVDIYNRKVDEFNRSVKEFNVVTDRSNASRASLIRRWNHDVRAFIDIHIPD